MSKKIYGITVGTAMNPAHIKETLPAVRYDEAQNLTSEQQAQARKNIGAADGTWANMPDKPFGESGWSMEWDGTPKEPCFDVLNTLFFCKVGEVKTKEELIGATCKVLWDGQNTEEFIITQSSFVDVNDNGFLVFSPSMGAAFASISQAGVYNYAGVVDIEFPSEGIWFMKDAGSDYHGSYLGKSELKKIDKKFLPDSSSGGEDEIIVVSAETFNDDTMAGTINQDVANTIQNYTGEKPMYFSLAGMLFPYLSEGVFALSSGRVTLVVWVDVDSLQLNVEVVEQSNINIEQNFIGSPDSLYNSVPSRSAVINYIAANCVALDENGKVPSDKLPSLGSGSDGKSAYDVAVENGFEGTESEWLESLKGGSGLSAYESAKLGGYEGTEDEFYSQLGTIGDIEIDTTDCIYKGPKKPEDEAYQYWLDTMSSPAVLNYKDEFGEWVPIAGGGGGSGEVISGLSLKPDWYGKTLAYGSLCEVGISWRSLYGGNPTGMIDYELFIRTPEGDVRKEYERVVPIGSRTINLTNYLTLGTTEIIIRLKNEYAEPAQTFLTVTTVKLEMEETFKEDRVYTSNITYYCTPKGAKGKTKKMYVKLDDILVVDGQETLDDGILQTIPLTVNTHGTHSIRAWFTCELEEGAEPIKSPEVYSEFAYVVAGDTTPIVAANCGVNKLEEYDSTTFDWYVFTPNADGTIAETTPIVQIYHSSRPTIVDGELPVLVLENVERGKKQEHTFKAEYPGNNYIIFRVGDNIRKKILINVKKSPVDVSAVTTNLLLNLSPQYHRQNDPNREQWVSETPEGKIVATLEDFNFTSDGWLTDGSGKSTVLRVRDDARVKIPVDIFTEEINNTGMVIEFELATHDVLDYEATIVKCMNSGVGIEIKANQATLKTKNNTLVTPFREGEQVRVTFVIESKDSATNLILIYINGVMSGAKQYTSTDYFAQDNVQGIEIGSNLCATDIYAIRVYKTALGRRDILTNWIADTQNRELLLERHKRNNVFHNNELHPDYLPEGLPYIVFYTNEDGLPQAKGKGEERYLSGKYVDANRSFTFNNAQVKVQGTSSSGYPRKNYTMTFDEAEGIFFTGKRDGVDYTDEQFFDFKMFDNSVPTNSFCFKADYASSEGANNVELVKLFNDICPVQTPPQLEDNKVRQGIDGFPMVIFCYHDGAYYFIGKYNFNNDKGTPEVFGMTDGVESWEVTNNSTAMGEYKEDDFEAVIYKEETDPTTGQTVVKEVEKWLETFEARYPDDYEGYENLQKMVSWVRSTWRGEADDTRPLSEAVNTYGYEYDSADYRKAKFINEVSHYFNLDHLCFFYLFTSFFLMIDNREKNTFPTRYLDGLWYFLPYDFDTALGINNSGELVFGHGLEDFDEGIYNGADSVLWCNVRDYFADKISAMYVSLRGGKLFNYDEIVRRFSEHQGAWGEAVFNEDSFYKYIAILLNKAIKENHLGKLQGNKAAQMRHWLFNRFRYFDAKYVTRDAKNEIVIIRPNYIEGGNNNHRITITPYADTYCAVNFDSMSGDSKPVPRRAYKGVPVTFDNPKARPDNAVVHIYNASQITDLGDLSGQYTSEFVAGSATRLQRVVLGSDDIVNEELNIFSLGNNKLLKYLNVKNCPKLAGDIDISGCSGIEEAYFDGTSITSLVLPEGGSCRVLHLPETITNLTVLNHKVTDFKMPNYNNLSTLWLELNETSKGTFDLKSMLNTMITRFKASAEGELGRLRVKDFELTGSKAFDTAAEVIDFYNDLRSNFKGLDANGNAGQDESYLKNMLRGKIQIKEQRGILQREYDEMVSKFPYVDLAYTRIRKFFVTFVNAAGAVLATQELDYGETPIIPDCPTTGYHYICNGSLVEVTDDVTYVLSEEIDTYTFEWIIGDRVVTTYQTYAPDTAPSTPSGYTYGSIVDEKAVLGFTNVGYRTGDRTRANGNPIVAKLKGMKTITGLNWGSNGISSDTHNTISNTTNTSFRAETLALQNYALRKIGIDTSTLLGFATTIQSITVHFNGSASSEDGPIGIVRAVISDITLGTGNYYQSVDFSKTSITINLNSSTATMLANSKGKQYIWFGLYESITGLVTANFSNVSFDITYHTDD